MNKLGRGPLEDATKYQSSSPYGLGQEDLKNSFYISM